MRKQGVKCPIIMLTGHASDSDQIHGLDSGANDYVAKPFKLPVLLARIRAQLRQHEQSEDAVFGVGPYTLPAGREAPARRGGEEDPPDREGNQHPEVPLPRRQRGGGARRAAARGLGLQCRRDHPHARDPHLPPAPEDRARPGQRRILVTEPGGYRLVALRRAHARRSRRRRVGVASAKGASISAMRRAARSAPPRRATPGPSGVRASRRFRRSARIGGDPDEPAPLQRLQRRGQRGAVHRQHRRHRAQSRRLGPVQRHQQRELPVGQAERPERLVEPPRQRPRRALRLKAQAVSRAPPRVTCVGRAGRSLTSGNYVDINVIEITARKEDRP